MLGLSALSCSTKSTLWTSFLGQRRWRIPLVFRDDLQIRRIVLIRWSHDLHAVLSELIKDVPVQLSIDCARLWLHNSHGATTIDTKAVADCGVGELSVAIREKE